MNKKKIMWIVLFIIVIIAIIFIISIVAPKDSTSTNDITNTTNTTYNKNSNNVNKNEITTNQKSDVEYIKTELSDGVLYSIDGKEYKSDIVVGDNYFDTTINDMYYNPESYMNKNIEIEGMYLENSPYMFVGRYSTSNLCAYCPVGYSYLEYQLKGNIDREFTDEKEWIKLIGKLAVGNDETSDYQDYYYLEVLSLEVMNEKGQTTVNN